MLYSFILIFVDHQKREIVDPKLIDLPSCYRSCLCYYFNNQVIWLLV